ncbi:MAG: NAD-dependent protein deacylase Sir2 [Deltaproteobacteria bacterium]|jgi:NAD-dependent deacetylase|nr:NAD-dependent protein deacylase Sir2 [Deltaproteobacteria bacterium]
MADTFPRDYTLSGLMEGESRITVITGSGIDVEAGLPSFRGEKGYYEDREAAYLASVDALHSEPVRQWRWYLNRFVSYHATPPAASHFALAELEVKSVENFLGIVTQNISGLHRKAGSQKVFEIHGCIHEMRSLKNGRRQPLPKSWIDSPPDDQELKAWRPNVCFIGESYDDYPLPESIEACRNCDVVLVIGTAGVIHTPVWLAEEGRISGAVVVNVNPNPGEVDKVSDHTFRGTASEYFNYNK